MENVPNFLAEDQAGDAMFESQQLNFYPQHVSHPDPEEDETEDEDKDEGNDSTDDNPPVDPDVNQAPVVTQPGTKPK